MGRAPCCSKVGLHRGAWSDEEDKLLTQYIQTHGEGQWRSMPSKAGLLRCGKSCRLRWMNYLRPGIKRGNFTPEENETISRLHSLHGNRWSFIATELTGRTDNEIKNHWNSHLKCKNHPDDNKNQRKRKKKNKTDDKVEILPQPASSPSPRSESSTWNGFESWNDEGEGVDWLNRTSLFEMEQNDGFDLLIMKDEESNMLEKLYHECLHLLGDGDGNVNLE